MKQLILKPLEIIQIIASKNLSGCMTVSNPQTPGSSWNLYLGEGRLHYASAAQGQLQRLNCLWQHLPFDLPQAQFSLESAPGLTRDEPNDYELLGNWKDLHQIPLSRFRALLVYLSREALVQIFSHNRLAVQFHSHHNINPILIAAPVKDLVKPVLEEIRLWRGVRPLIPSPFYQIILDNRNVDRLCRFWEEMTGSNAAVSSNHDLTMSHWIQIFLQGFNLYELAFHTKVEPQILAKWLQPALQAQLLQISLPQAIATPVKTPKPVIACIDDSRTVQRQVKMILEMADFEVVSITDPTSSLSVLANQIPQLILMDISMPEIDGYELSAMLRRSLKLRNVPIVMLTGRDGIIDRLRAQLVGAADFLTKPVQPEKLLARVQQFTQEKIAS